MPTNKEWLYSLDPHALTEWFESEHDSNDTLGAKKVVSVHTGTANDANVSTYVENKNDTLDGARAALDAIFAELTAKCYELQAKVDELTEQRDRWRENWNRRNVEYSDLVNEFEELRDEKTKLESTLDVILDALADYWLPDER